MKHAVLAAAALALAASSHSPQALAQAQYPALTAKPVNLRAGPSRDYPIIAVLPNGFQVFVQGCLSDYAWCDVVAGYERGWVYAGNILFNYDNDMRPILNWGPVIGIGVIGFAFNDYWPRYYANRPWFGERHRWEHVPPPRYAGPRPGWQQPRVQPQPQPQWQPRPVPQPGAQPAPRFERRTVPQPQPQPPQGRVQPRAVPQPAPAMPPGQARPGFRGAPPAAAPPQGAQPNAAPAPQPGPPGPGRGGERRHRQQEREQ